MSYYIISHQETKHSRTDFYHVPDGPYENMGFPPGVAEELVIKVLRTCDPKTWKAPNGSRKPLDMNNEIMCSTVAQEVEVIADGDLSDEETGVTDTVEPDKVSKKPGDSINKSQPERQSAVTSTSKGIPEDYKPPEIPTQKNSDTYNGAERDKYSWSQNIMELGNVAYTISLVCAYL